MNRYLAFGLKIESEAALSELQPCDFEEPDITIRLGKVENIQDSLPRRRKIWNDRFLLNKEGVAKYDVEKGSRIVLEPYPDATLEEIKLFLLGSCMGAVLFQRKILPVHGSCVRIGESGVLLTGKSGSGKSTVAAALLAKGCKMLTDDVAAIRLGDADSPMIYPGYPSQKLWEDAILRMDGAAEKISLSRISNDLNKFSVKREGSFCGESTPLGAVYEIIPGEAQRLSVDEVTATEKLKVLLTNTYRKVFAQSMGLTGWQFEQAARIANKAKVYRIIRPAQEHLEGEIARIIWELQTNAGGRAPL